MATIFYPTGGAFSALTPQIVTASYLTPVLDASQYDALNTTRTMAMTPGTAGNAEGAMLGLNLATVTVANSVTVVLQEWSGGAWVNRATATLAADVLAGAHLIGGSLCWVYFPFAASYAVTAAAGTWRLSVSSAGPQASSLRWLKSGANYAYALVLATATAYAPADDILFREGQTFVIDQSITFTTAVTGINTCLQWENPPVASYTLTGTTLYWSADMRIEIGTVGVPVPFAQKAVIAITNMRCMPTYAGPNNHEFSWYGEKPTAYRSTLAANALSGQPIIVTTDDMSAAWSAGEVVYLSGLRGFESKTILSVVGTTVTFTANLTNNLYAGWFVLDWTRAIQCGIELQSALFAQSFNAPVVWQLSGLYISAAVQIQANDGYSLAWTDLARLTPATMDTIIGVANAYMRCLFSLYGDYISGSVFTDIYMLAGAYTGIGIRIDTGAGAECTFTRLLSGGNGNVHLYLAAFDSALTDIQASGSSPATTGGSLDASLIGCAITRLKVYGGTYGLYMRNLISSTFTGCSFDGAASIGIWVPATAIDVLFDDCDFGQDVANASDFPSPAHLLRILVKRSSTFTVSGGNLATAVAGSYIKGHLFNRTANDHRSWWKYGLMQSVGDGLTDTTVRTAGVGKFAIRLEPQSSTNPLEWTFSVPTGDITGLSMTVAVWVKIANAAYYAGTHQQPRLTVDYDDGTEAYSEATASTDWQLVSVTFTPTTSYGQITVTVSGATDAVGANAYFYLDDWAILYPAGYPLRLGGMDLWADALPVTPPISTVFTSEEVWTVPRAVLTGAGTIGKAMSDVYALVALYLDAAISTRLASGTYTAPDNAGILAAIATAQADLNNPDQYKADVSGLAVPGDEMALTGAAIDAIIADMVTALTASGKTPAQALRILLAVAAGVTRGMGDNAPEFDAIDGSGTVIEATQDDDGNRTAVTIT